MSKPRKDRPSGIGGVLLIDAYRYLDALRDSGDTNMLGAGAWLMAEYDITEADAHEILGFWMKDFSKEEDND